MRTPTISRPSNIISLLLLGLWTSLALSGTTSAQGDSPQKSEESANTGVRSYRFFDRPVDLWRSGLTLEKKPEAIKKQEHSPTLSGPMLVTETIWAEPTRLPDGRYTLYVPPRQVLQFLENPSKETARAYMAWQKERADKLRKALELLAKVKEEEDRKVADEKAKATKDSAKTAEPFRILYFSQKGCPACVTQDEALTKWLARHPEASLEKIEKGDKPELWLKYEVTGTPTMVFVDEDETREVVFAGAKDETALEAVLSELRKPKEEDSSSDSEKETP